MLGFLHSFRPEAVLVEMGPLTIYWYGFFIVLGIILGLNISLYLAKKINMDKNSLLDMSFWAIIFAIVGARAYHILIQLPFYLDNPIQIPQIWNGGIAIHGAIIGGFLAIFFYCRKKSLPILKVASVIAPGLALGQAIGRWGNYFNQELFGRPTDLFWGIPISAAKVPAEFAGEQFFHPAFLYESIGSLFIFIFLFSSFFYLLKKRKSVELLLPIYIFLYSILRFLTEYIRIDPTPEIFGLRFPQIISILLIFFSVWLFSYILKKSPIEKK